jgi:hypothetical protein
MLSNTQGGLNRNSYLENNLNFPNIITCPSELVALSAALGYAQATGVPVRDYVIPTAFR